MLNNKNTNSLFPLTSFYNNYWKYLFLKIQHLVLFISSITHVNLEYDILLLFMHQYGMLIWLAN
jgi:hypothetical protein